MTCAGFTECIPGYQYEYHCKARYGPSLLPPQASAPSDQCIVGHRHRRGLTKDVSTNVKSTNQVGLLARTGNNAPICLYMDFSTRMTVTVTVEDTRQDWDKVAHVVHPREVGHLRIKKGCPSLISDTRRPKGATSDGRSRG